jgi:hypothetical protein
VKRSLLSLLLLLAACKSGPDPATTGGDVDSLLVPSASTGSYVASVVVDSQGQLYLVADESLSVAGFAPDVTLPSTWIAPSVQPEIEIAVEGDTVWWAASNGQASSLWSSTEVSFVSPPPAVATFPAFETGDVVGLIADSTAVYAAVTAPEPPDGGAPSPPGGPSPDSWQWPAGGVVDTPWVGSLYRIVPGNPPSVLQLDVTGGITFLPGFMQHVLAQNKTQVYWVDSTHVGSDIGRVMVASKAAWASDTGKSVGVLQPAAGLATGFVGLAANDSYVAWTVAPEPSPGVVGCWVWSSLNGAAPTEIFDGDLAQTSFDCNGLAIDSTYAYFAMVEVYVPPGSLPVLLGTGVARVPLAGGPLQTVALTSDRWYGARRLLVDDTYVYAIDPSYVLRFPKSVFGP